jgi:hypothetical protein
MTGFAMFLEDRKDILIKRGILNEEQKRKKQHASILQRLAKPAKRKRDSAQPQLTDHTDLNPCNP